MKSVMLAIAVAVLAGMPARAQQRTPLPDVVIGAPPPPLNLNRDTGNGAGAASRASAPKGDNGPEHCGAGDQSLGCINERLKRQVDSVNPPVTNTPPIDAKSQDLKVGVVNIPAVKQQYGRNFGISAVPYRPPTSVYVPPVGHR